MTRHMKSFFDQAVIFSEQLQKFSFRTDEDDSGDSIMQVCGSQFIRLAQIQLAMVRTWSRYHSSILTSFGARMPRPPRDHLRFGRWHCAHRSPINSIFGPLATLSIRPIRRNHTSNTWRISFQIGKLLSQLEKFLFGNGVAFLGVACMDMAP